jgi:hypothetical protein
MSAVRPCQGSSGTEVLLDETLRLDLGVCASRLEAAGLDVTDARTLLVVTGDVQVILFPSGRMLVHTSDLEAAREFAARVLRISGVSIG